jgi:hypothetical protein
MERKEMIIMRMTNKRETMAAIQEKNTVREKTEKAVRCAYALGMAASTFAGAAVASGAVAFAADENAAINQIVSIMGRVGRVAGIALMIFGIYEVVMAFLQQAPEQKTKGVLMLVVGAVLTGIKEMANAFTGGTTPTT